MSFFSHAQEMILLLAVTWLARTSPGAAARWRIGLLRIVEKLESDPNRYSGAEEGVDLDVDLRELLYGRRRNIWRVLFTIEGQTVNVLRVRHAAQDRITSKDL